MIRAARISLPNVATGRCQPTSGTGPFATLRTGLRFKFLLSQVPGKPRSCRFRCAFGDHGSFEQPGTSFLAQPVAVAADRDDVTVVQQPVEDCGRDDGIAEHGAPLADG